MGQRRTGQRRTGLLLASLLLAAAGAVSAQSTGSNSSSLSTSTVSRLAGDWRSTASVVVSSSATPQYRAAAAVGSATSSQKLERIILLLANSSAQQQALDQKLADLANSSSASYHHWLTPTEFAASYANSTTDVAAVVSWLESEGFTVAALPTGRGWIEFSGTAAQVEQAFGTSLQQASTSNGTRSFLSGEISVPSALAPLIQGLVSLDGTVSTPALTTPQKVSSSVAELAALSTSGSAEALTPKIVGQRLHINELHASGLQGSGQSIAVVARGNVVADDVAAFRSAFSLSASTLKVVPDGTDPGLTDDQAMATLATSWAGAAAPEAQIVLVPAATTAATDGVDLSLAAVVGGKLASTVVVGYSSCEAGMSAAHQAFYQALYRQAAAQGMSIVAATGDSGAAACSAAGETTPVNSGYAVNALASTEWDTAVGAVALETSTLSAWSPASETQPAYAGGGGKSTLYAVPTWQQNLQTKSVSSQLAQTQSGSTAAQKTRLLPDVALPTASDTTTNAGLAFCLSAATSDAISGSDSTSGNCTVMRAGGSAAAASVFAGIGALVAEKYGTQGNLASHLYALEDQSGVYEDVAEGSAQLWCAASSSGCGSTGQIGFTAATGYDLTSGLGSVNAQALVTAWPYATGTAVSAIAWTTTTQKISGTDTLALTVTVSSNDSTVSTTPTGTVTFYDSTTSTTLGTATVTGGSATLTLAKGTLTAGTAHTLYAIYNGSSVYATSTSSTITITALANSAVTWTTVSQTITVSDALALKVTVSSSDSTVTSTPTGTVTFYDSTTSTTLGSATLASGVATLTLSKGALTSGTAHLIYATYNGSSVYATSTSSTIAITVSGKIPTTTTVSASATTVAAGSVVILTATVVPDSQSTSESYPTGTVEFFSGTTLIGSATLTQVGASDQSQGSISLSASASGLAAGTNSVTAVYLGDTYYATSTSGAITVIMQDFTITASSSLPSGGLTIVKGASGSATYNIAGVGGFNDQVQVVCAVPSQDYMTCTASPQQVTLPGSVTFVVQTFKTGTAVSQIAPMPLWPRAAGATALAVLGFLFLPFGGRVRRRLFECAGATAGRTLVLLLLLAGLVGTGVGCTSSTTVASGGTPLGVATLKITATDYVNTTVPSHSVYLTVNVVTSN